MKTSLDPRHQKRQKVVTELFAWEEQRIQPEIAGKVVDRDTWEAKTNKVIENQELLDKLIQVAAPEWELSKINHIDLAILRLATYELSVEFEQPAKVIIDEAVELAKEYGNEGSPGFINGALGKLLTSRDRILHLIAAKLGTDVKSISESDNLTTDLNASTLEIDDLLLTLERDLNITFGSQAAPQTVGDILTHIEDTID